MASEKKLGRFKKANGLLQTSPVPSLLVNGPNASNTKIPWQSNSVRFKNINENGRVRLYDKNNLLLHFHYVNDFYGSCTFEARIIEQASLPLTLRNDSVVLENYEVKRGSLPLLLRIAKTFFGRILGKCNSVHQLMEPKVGFAPPTQ